MSVLRLLLCVFLFIQCAIGYAQARMDIDGGKVDKSVSRYTKVVDGVRLVSAKVAFQSPLELSFSVENEVLEDDNIIKNTLLNGLNEYTVIFYLTAEGNNSKTINILSNGYSKYTIKDLFLNPKESFEYYVFDPNTEKKITRVIKRREESKYLSQGRKFLEAKEYDKALLEFDKVIAINVLSDSAYYGKGQVYLAQEMYEEAWQDYKMALNVNDDFSEAYDDLIKFNIYELGTKRTGSTKFTYSEYEKVRKQNNSPVNNKILFGSMSDQDYAIKCYKEALMEDDYNADAYCMLIYSYVKNIEYNLAAQTFFDYMVRTDIKSNLIASTMLSGVNTVMVTSDKPLRKKMVECYIDVYKEVVSKYPFNIHFIDKLAAFYSIQRVCSDMDDATRVASIKESITMYSKIIELAKQKEELTRISKCYKLIANCYNLLNEPEQEQKYKAIQNQIDTQIETEKNNKDKINYQNSIAKIQSGNMTEADEKECLNTAYEFLKNKKINEAFGIYKTLINTTESCSGQIVETINKRYAISYGLGSGAKKEVVVDFANKAISLGEFAIEKYPDNYDFHMLLVKYYGYLNDTYKITIYSEKVIKIVEAKNEIANSVEVGRVYRNLADIYRRSMANMTKKEMKIVAQKAEICYLKAVELYKSKLLTEADIKSWGYSLYYNIASIYEKLGDVDSALDYYQKSYDNGNIIDSSRAMRRLKGE